MARIGSGCCTGLLYIMYAYKYLFAAPGPIHACIGSDATPTQPVISPVYPSALSGEEQKSNETL